MVLDCILIFKPTLYNLDNSQSVTGVLECNMVFLKINNIKCRFIIEYPDNYLKQVAQISQFNSVKKSGNIVVIRTSSAVYVVFSGVYVNLTGIKKIRKVRQYISEFYDLFSIPIKVNSYKFKVDNISANTVLNIPDFNINTCATKLANTYNGLILQNTLKFPSVSIRFTFGTIVIFRSTKVNVIGVKNFRQLLFLKNVLQKLQT